jgi:hypothetical protein
MKCPHCDIEIGSPVVGYRELKCAECGETLVQLVDLALDPEELAALDAIITRAITDAQFYEDLRQDPYGVLESGGIRRQTVQELADLMGQYGAPTIAACLADSRSWPVISPRDDDQLV